MIVSMPGRALSAEDKITAEVELYSMIIKDYTSWSFEYSDSWFEEDADAYSHSIARASLGLALSGFRAKRGPVDGNAIKWMTDLGFTDLVSEDYHRETSINTISTVMGHKQLPSGETLLAISVCGQGYENEWLSNLDIGDEQEHRGFSSAAQKVVQRAERYMEEHELSEPRLWLSGFSRAAAVANLAGAHLMEKGLFSEKNAFIYTFATPNSTKNPIAHANIFNIVGKFDPVSRIPFQEWGFDRHGNTLYTPAQETDSDYRQKLKAADAPFYELTGTHMWNDTLMNQHLAVVEAFLLSNVPTTADYDIHMRDPIAAAWNKTNLGAIVSVLDAMKAIPVQDPFTSVSQQQKVIELIEYTFSAAFGAFGEDETLVELLESGLTAPAVLLEHMPEIYLAWIFSSEDPEEIYTDATQYMQLIVSDDAEVSLFDQEGGFILRMDHYGGKSESTKNEDYLKRIRPVEERPLIMAVNAGGKNMLVLPKDQAFPFTMISQYDADVYYYGIHYDIRRSSPTMSSFRLLHMEPEKEYLAFLLTPQGQELLNADEPLWGDSHEINRHFEAEQLLTVSDAYDLGGMNLLHFSVRSIFHIVIVIAVVLINTVLRFVFGGVLIIRHLLRRHKRSVTGQQRKKKNKE